MDTPDGDPNSRWPEPEDEIDFDTAEQAGVDATLRTTNTPNLAPRHSSKHTTITVEITAPDDLLALEADLVAVLRAYSDNPNINIDIEARRERTQTWDTVPF